VKLGEDLSMYSVFGRTAAPQKGGLTGYRMCGQLRDIFWPVWASVWYVTGAKSSLGAAYEVS